jgi:hypothetical protein
MNPRVFQEGDVLYLTTAFALSEKHLQPGDKVVVIKRHVKLDRVSYTIGGYKGAEFFTYVGVPDRCLFPAEPGATLTRDVYWTGGRKINTRRVCNQVQKQEK